jgi:hypothetical protein
MNEDDRDLSRRISAMLFGHLAERGILNNAHLCRAVVADVLTAAKTLAVNYVEANGRYAQQLYDVGKAVSD